MLFICLIITGILAVLKNCLDEDVKPKIVKLHKIFAWIIIILFILCVILIPFTIGLISSFATI